MVVRLRTLALLAALLCVVVAGARAEKVADLKAQGYINDFARVLDAEGRARLTALCAEVDSKAGAQIAVVTIRTLDDLTPQDFANRLFKQWGVGHKDNRGVLVLLAVNDRKYFTEVGYGLEPILPDGRVGGFGREMVPYLKQSDYDGALLRITSRIAGVIAADRGVTLTGVPQRTRRDSDGGGIPAYILVLLGILLLVGRVLIGMLRLFGFVRGRGLGAGRGGWGGWLSGGGGWGGGSFGGGGGGFGGFGGGSSGGGGAGGSW